MTRGRLDGRDDGDIGEVLFEATRVGNTLRLSAIDPGTGIEVVVFGPAVTGRAALERLALRKLQAALARRDDSARR